MFLCLYFLLQLELQSSCLGQISYSEILNVLLYTFVSTLNGFVAAFVFGYCGLGHKYVILLQHSVNNIAWPYVRVIHSNFGIVVSYIKQHELSRCIECFFRECLWVDEILLQLLNYSFDFYVPPQSFILLLRHPLWFNFTSCP